MPQKSHARILLSMVGVFICLEMLWLAFGASMMGGRRMSGENLYLWTLSLPLGSLDGMFQLSVVSSPIKVVSVALLNAVAWALLFCPLVWWIRVLRRRNQVIQIAHSTLDDGE
jgi:hypothetical protein